MTIFSNINMSVYWKVVDPTKNGMIFFQLAIFINFFVAGVMKIEK